MRFSPFASVKVSIALICLLALAVLLGAWCPQESQVGYQKVVETFGADLAGRFRAAGLTDIFHAPVFLLLIALISINMIVVSFQRVFPKIKNYKLPMPYLGKDEILKLPNAQQVSVGLDNNQSLLELKKILALRGYASKIEGQSLKAESGKISRFAATVTHIGLLSLLTGVTITSWTGFSGFQPVLIGRTLTFSASEHSKLWIGKLPLWRVRVDDTRKETYDNGDPKQWYSKLSVINDKGKVLKQQEISVNNPLSYEGVDIYQSSWGLDSILLSFNGRPLKLSLQQMGGTHAAFMPLDQNTTLIFSLRSEKKPLRLFAKIPEWKAPKMLVELPSGYVAEFGAVKIGYLKALPATGLQYKCDPGLPITYTAFGIIMLGVLLAALPHRQLWAYAEEGNEQTTLILGGFSHKAKKAFNKNLISITERIQTRFPAKAESQSICSASSQR